MQRSSSDTTVQQADLTIKQRFNIDVASGLLSGAICAGLFNPWDKALSLSLMHSRPFLRSANFKSPYQGALQAIFQRACIGGAYFTAQSQLKSNLYPYLRHSGINEFNAQFVTGLLAGSISGVLTNSISATKYYTWGHEERTFFVSTREMWQHGGIKPFIKGTKATIARDAVFGCIYEVLRHYLRHQVEKLKHHSSDYQLTFYCNIIAATVATVASGPFNYARTMQYATPPNETPLGISQILSNIWNESKVVTQSPLSQLGFFQQKFRVGWGTVRVGVGMGAGQLAFEYVKERLSHATPK